MFKIFFPTNIALYAYDSSSNLLMQVSVMLMLGLLGMVDKVVLVFTFSALLHPSNGQIKSPALSLSSE